jgi:pimeloyl-ACP methyl ester carboxylesterase
MSAQGAVPRATVAQKRKVAKVVAFARRPIGVPYVWGGAGRRQRGFDCSGLVYAACRWRRSGTSFVAGAASWPRSGTLRRCSRVRLDPAELIRLLVLTALAVLCAACGGDSAVQTRTVPGEPGLQYDVDGVYLYLLCSGRGSPTVVLEAGLGGTHHDWETVQPALGRTSRVCSYDRAGLGFSQLAPKGRTPEAKANDLHDLLSAARVDAPYVLVGHSYGGMLVRVFAAEYERDVAGVVMLDSSHPDQDSRFLAALPPRRADESREVRRLRATLTSRRLPNPEGVDWRASSDETRATGSLGDSPLIVVTAGQSDEPAGVPPLVVRRLRRVWLGMQDELARLSSESVHVIAVYSPHYVMSNLGQPALVLRAVRAVVQAARSDGRLPSCRALFAPPGGKCMGG